MDSVERSQPARHLPPRDPSVVGHDKPYHLPRPVVLDTHLRLSPQCKLLTNFQNGSGRRPWIISAQPNDQQELAKWTHRSDLLEGAGAKIIAITAEEGNQGVFPLVNLDICMSDTDCSKISYQSGQSFTNCMSSVSTP